MIFLFCFVQKQWSRYPGKCNFNYNYKIKINTRKVLLEKLILILKEFAFLLIIRLKMICNFSEIFQVL